MELRVKGFANILDANFDLLDDLTSVVVSNMSSTGKTTIAKLLYAFLTGEVKGDIISKEVEASEAVLTFRGNVYRLSIHRSGRQSVDRVIDKDYAQYLALTEVGPMYAFFSQPDKFSIDIVADKVVKKPSTREIDEELSRLEQSGSTPRLVKEYEESISKYEKELQDVERRLNEITEKLERATRSEKAEVVIRKQRIAEDIARINSQIASYEEEAARLSSELQPSAYEEYRSKRKRLGDEVEKLERMKLTLGNARDAIKAIQDSLRKLVPISDVLADINVYLFGTPVDPDTLKVFVTDCEAAVETIVAKLGEVEAKLSSIRQELSACDAKIRQYNEKFNRREAILNEIQKLQEEKRKLEYEQMRVEKEVNRLLRETGKTEAELIQEYVSREDVQKLMGERARLSKRKAELTTTIESLRNMVSSLKKDMESEGLRKRYEELKRMKSEIESAYQRDYRMFVDKFRENMAEMFRIIEAEGIKIRHFEPETVRFDRQGNTFSKSERYIIVASYILSVARALCELGYSVPFVVLDVLSPMDWRYERALMNMVKTVPVKVLVLVTKNESSIRAIG